MSKPGRKYKYEGLGSPLGASRGGDEARAKGGRARLGAPITRAPIGEQARRSGLRGRRGRQGSGHRAPRAESLRDLIDFLFPRGSGPAALAPPAPARAGPASPRSRAAAGAPMPRAAPRWPPLLLLSLLLQPPARGAPAQPGAGGPASELVVPTRRAGGAGELALHLSAFGRSFVLRLAPDASFLAPAFKIESLGGSGAAAGGERELRACFFSGTVNGAPGSLAAVSLCGGLSGSFLLDGEEFTVQPRGAGDALQRPHLLRRWGPGGGARRTPAHPLPRGPESGARKGDGPRQQREKEEKDEAREEESKEDGSEGARELPAPRGTASRTKRFVSEARFVETLLVADASMAAFYGPDLQVGLALPRRGPLSPPGVSKCSPSLSLGKSFTLSTLPKTDPKQGSLRSEKARELFA